MATNTFLENTKNSEPNWLLQKALAHVSTNIPLNALELGCGAGNDVGLMLDFGFSVDIVDNNNAVIDYLPKCEKIDFHNISFEKFKPKPNFYDLVNGQWSLPFIKPQSFRRTWLDISKGIKTGAIFVGNFFGTNDEWCGGRRNMTFFSDKSLKELFTNYKLLEYTEKEYVGKLANGDNKYWHIFEVIAEKK